MLVHWVVVVVAPEVVVAHLVPLVVPGRAPGAYPDVVTLAPAPPPPGVTSGVRVTREAALTRALRTRVLLVTFRSKATLKDAARVSWTDKAEGLVLHPATQVTIPVLPHSIL